MLPWDACVTCYSGASMAHGGGIRFCVHDMKHFWYKTSHMECPCSFRMRCHTTVARAPRRSLSNPCAHT